MCAAVGQDDGFIRVLRDIVAFVDTNKSKRPLPMDSLLVRSADGELLQPSKKRKVPIVVVRFSPNGKYLASGCTDGYIDLFSVDTDEAGVVQAFKFVGVCKGHTGAISQIDFDLESKYLQSNTWSDELKFWSISSCSEHSRSTDLRDTEWATFTCRLAWHVLACVPTGNESMIRSICRQVSADGKTPSVFAAGFSNGALKLMPFPSPEDGFTGLTYKSSCRAIDQMCYSRDDSFLIVAGGPEPTLEVYRHFEAADIPSDDSDVREILRASKVVSAKERQLAGEDPEMQAVKPYLGAIFPPSTEPFIKPLSAFPNYSFLLDHVQSFRGHDTRHSVFFNASGGLIFMACGMVVVQDSILPDDASDAQEVPRQRHFSEHQGDVSCIAVHPGGWLVASADCGKTPVILVWNSEEFDERKGKFEVVGKVAGTLIQGKLMADRVGISHICFGGDMGQWLFAIGLSEGCPVSWYRTADAWQTSQLLATISTRLSKFLALACNPVDNIVVTCGVKFLKFWTVHERSGSMTAEKAFYGTEQARTMCCVEFLLLGNSNSRTVTGSIDGCIFIWYREQLMSILKDAHHVPTLKSVRGVSIFDLAFDRVNALLFSGGRDGMLRVWSVDDSIFFSDVATLKRKGESGPLQGNTCPGCGFFTSVPAPGGIRRCANCNSDDLEDVADAVACIRSVSVRGPQVVLGTSRGEIILVVPDSFAVTQASACFPKEMRVAVASHGNGTVSCIHFHPVYETIFFTVGDDCILRMWDVETKRLALCIRIEEALRREGDEAVDPGAAATALHVSQDGNLLAVGFSNGYLALLSFFGRDKKLRLCNSSETRGEFAILRRSRGISCLAFGKWEGAVMLAVGTFDGLLHLFQCVERSGRDPACRFKTTCRGHSGSILSIDWSEDGKVIQSSSRDYELFFWRLDESSEHKLRCKTQRPMTCRNVVWNEWTSPLGWYVQGTRLIKGVSSARPFTDENAITSAYAHFPDSDLCIFGDIDGQISLLPFPSSEKSPLLSQARVLTGAITCVRRSRGEQSHVVASTERAGGLYIWRIKQGGQANWATMGQVGRSVDLCWQTVMHRLTETEQSELSTDDQVPESTRSDDQFLSSVHPYLSAIRQPLGWRPSAENLKLPDNELKLEYVYGYRGHDSTRNLFKINKNQELLYYVASVCIILNHHNERRTQRIFDKHHSEIQCIAVSPDRTTVASVSSNLRARVLVWNSKTLKQLGCVNSVHPGKVSAMCFSSDGKVLALAVANGKTTTVAFYEWKDGHLRAEHPAQPWKILALECNPLTGTFVSAGVRHVYFWRLVGNNLSSQMALIEESQVMTSVAFLGQHERENTIVVGNSTGHLLLWKEDKEAFGRIAPDKLISAHNGPVFDIRAEEGSLISCSKGGEVCIWKHNGKCDIARDQFFTVALPEESAECTHCPVHGSKGDREARSGELLACLRAVVRIKKDMSYALVVGTGNNNIYEAFVDPSAKTLRANVIMPSHSEGKILGMASHPGKAVFATCGEDKSLKTWDREERSILRETLLGNEPTVLVYSVDGSRLVVGLSNGEIRIYDAATLECIGEVDEYPPRKVRDMKFSPDGRLLAAACDDAKIHVYAVPLTRQFASERAGNVTETRDVFSLVGKCKGHARSVVRLDWSADGARMQSESEDYDTILWDMSASIKQSRKEGDQPHVFEPLRNAQAHADLSWQTRDCLLTWHTGGLLRPVADFNSLLTSARSKLGDALAVGDCKGGIRLYRFPCYDEESRPRLYHGHSPGVSKVCFRQVECVCSPVLGVALVILTFDCLQL